MDQGVLEIFTGSTAVRGDSKTAAQGDSKTAVQGDSTTAVQGDSKTVVQGDSTTALQGESKTAVDGDSTTAVQGDSNNGETIKDGFNVGTVYPKEEHIYDSRSENATSRSNFYFLLFIRDY